ncbi:MAG: ATP-dependent helicase [Bacillota bacterium]|nr:ATP-dependent helicase [Bacillota bacterium]
MILSDEQKRASQSLSGSSLVLGTPGAGKTTMLLQRINNLIAKGVDPERILTISFSRAAARELEERFKAKNPDQERLPHFHTIHAFSYIVLRDYGRRKGIDYKLLEGDKSLNKYKLLAKFYKQVHKTYISDEKLDKLINRIGYVKNMLLDPKTINSEIDCFDQIYCLYEGFKKKYKYIDFDDMLEEGLRILKDNSSIRNKYINMYDYVQVDEGQDTSKLQMEIVKILTKKKNNLFIVADDDQSIYSFRGADPRGLFSLEADYKDLKIYYMETNFRSTKNIVLAAKSFIDQNQLRYKKDLKSSKDYSQPVEVVKVDSTEDQYAYILDKIKEADLDQVGILYRNNVSAMGLVEYLERKNIAFKLADSSKIKFYGHRITKDLENIINFAADPSRLDLFQEFFYKVKGYVSRLMLEDLKSLARPGNVLENLTRLADLKPYSIKSIEELQRSMEILASLPMDQKLDHIYTDLGYGAYLSYFSKKEGYGLESELLVFQNLNRISKKALDLREFIGRLKYLDQYVSRSAYVSEGLKLSTIHSAKGKEYKDVFLIDLYQGMFPAKSKDQSLGPEWEEERRLFYVAMTRAKERLTILYPGKIARKETEISEFLLELDQACRQ